MILAHKYKLMDLCLVSFFCFLLLSLFVCVSIYIFLNANKWNFTKHVYIKYVFFFIISAFNAHIEVVKHVWPKWIFQMRKISTSYSLIFPFNIPFFLHYFDLIKMKYISGFYFWFDRLSFKFDIAESNFCQFNHINGKKNAHTFDGWESH